MKKILALLLAAMMLLSLAACAGQAPNQGDTSKPDQEEVTTEPSAEEEKDDEGVFSYIADGVELVPGQPFDPSVLPETDNVFQVPSCAIEGTDNVYGYEAFELTAYDDGTGEVIYSIYLVDSNACTTEGLYMGDDLARVTELYGTDYVENDTELIYTKGHTALHLLMDGDFVISIEYRMAI